jgi:hypothetical protein
MITEVIAGPAARSVEREEACVNRAEEDAAVTGLLIADR